MDYSKDPKFLDRQIWASSADRSGSALEDRSGSALADRSGSALADRSGSALADRSGSALFGIPSTSFGSNV